MAGVTTMMMVTMPRSVTTVGMVAESCNCHRTESNSAQRERKRVEVQFFLRFRVGSTSADAQESYALFTRR